MKMALTSSINTVKLAKMRCLFLKRNKKKKQLFLAIDGLMGKFKKLHLLKPESQDGVSRDVS